MEFTGERFVPSLSGQIKYEHLHRYALSLPLAAGKSVLDIACGEGYGASLLAGVAKSVIGVDIEPRVIEHARSSYYDRNLKFHVGTCDSIPLPDASVEVVTSFETIEHHGKHEEMMLEIKRVLKPGGSLIISSPNRLTYSDEPHFVNEYHVKELYYDEFMELLDRHFSSIKCYGQRIAAGSFVFALNESDTDRYRAYSGDARTLDEKVSALSAPIYFIAVCSDRPVKYDLDSVYLDGTDDLFAAALTQQLNVQAGRMSSLATQVEHLSQEVSQKEALVQERDRQTAQSLEQATVLNQQLEELTRQAREKEVLLEERNRQDAESRTLIGEQLQELTRQVSEKEALLEERNRQNAESRALIAEQLQELTRQVSEKDLLLQEKEQRIGEKESRISQLSKELEELARHTKERETLLHQRDLQIQARNRQIEEKQRELQQHEQQLAKLTHELERKDFKLQSTGWQQREWEKRARAKEQELAQLLEVYRATKEDFSRSGSYRLGRVLSFPLRLVKRLAVPNENGLDNQSRINGAIRSESAVPEPQEKKNAHVGASLSESLIFIKEDVTPTGTESFRGTAPTLFDGEWYLAQNSDVARAGLDPLQHYLTTGAREGRAPHPLFDPKFYLQNYPEAAISGQNPLEHYLTEGWKKGFKPNPKFDPQFYVSTYPDIAEAGVEPLTHFATEGLREGRAGCPEDISFEPFEANFEIPRMPTPGEPVKTDIKAIAFYLPQFHPIPENDAWWGTGFTEWTNVRRGEPQFSDHYQPHVPSVLDYYDLREPEVLERQVQLAKDYGLYGFCFYYYWFAGKVLLDLPVRRMLETGKPDFPFCVCWANENWTRRWDGRESDVLIAQQHSPDDDLAFLRNIQKILLHKNYINVEGKPLLIVYQSSLLPDASATAARWREYFWSQSHTDLFLAAMRTFSDRADPREYGFDAGIQFPPHSVSSPVTTMVEGINSSFAGHVYDYNRTKWSFLDELRGLSSSDNIYPGVMPSWDNTARRRNQSSIWVDSSPESYYDWLCQASDFLRKNRPYKDKLLFINAWNEWAEGCHLEPDQLFGYAWLNATRLSLKQQESRAADNSSE